jgi:hypothetical protein
MTANTQGWVVNRVAATISFNNAPANAAVIVVNEYAASAFNASNVWAFGAWNPGFGWPSVVQFYSDRLIFAGSVSQPQTLWMSKTSEYTNFGKDVPLVDNDAITLTINARQVNAIKELVPMTDMIVMTSSAEWRLTTGADEVVAPGKDGFAPQTFWGSSGITSQVIGGSAIFVQGRGNVVRDLTYDYLSNRYDGGDLSIYAAHLLEGFTVIDMAFQQVPYSCVWMVRSDGALLCMTYQREQGVIAWSLCTTDGTFESVCTVPEGTLNAVYVTVRRTINGVVRVSVERLDDRSFLTDQRDAFFVDSGLSFDGRLVTGTQTLSGTGWTSDDTLTLTASMAQWVGSTDVGDQVKLVIDATYDGFGDVLTEAQELRLAIIGYVSSTVVHVRPARNVPVAFQGIAFSRWEMMRDTFSGLGHLEGKTVSILADANVHAQQVVTSGTITISPPAAVVHVGLPYRSLIESLDIVLPGQESVRDRPKNIVSVALLVKDTRGCKSGPDLDHLDEFKRREFEGYDDPIALYSGIMDVNVSSGWDKNGRFVVVQEDPLPACVLSLLPKVAISGVG